MDAAVLVASFFVVGDEVVDASLALSAKATFLCIAHVERSNSY
jgi:hypothetical protein